MPTLAVEHATELHDDDMSALCEATNAAILDGGGFGWVSPPGQQALERYFRGVMLVPERELFVARADGIITGSAQLVRQPRNNEAQAFAASVMHAFVAPFARGQGLARLMMVRIEETRPHPGLPGAEPRRARDADGRHRDVHLARLRVLGRAPGIRPRARPGPARFLLHQGAEEGGRG